MSDSFDAYHKWLGIPPEEQPPDHYRLLGIKRFESDADVISHAADQRMAHVRSLQSGQHAKLSQRLLNEISNARVCLLNVEQKAKYDADLAASLKPTKKLAKAKPLPEANPVESAHAGIAFSAEAASTLRGHEHARRKSSPVTVAMSAVGVVAIVAVVGVVLALRSGDQPSPETAQAEQIDSEQTDPVKSPPAEPPTAVSPDPSTVDPVDAARPESAADTDVEAAEPPSAPTSAPSSIDRTEPQPPVEPPKPSPPEAAGVEPPPNPEAADVRLPIPDDAAQRAALQLVRDVFEADSKNAQTPEKRAALAERMIQAAADTKDDPATKFVLLRVARDMAALAGNAELVVRTVDRLAELHRIDAIEMKIQTLSKAGDAAQDAEARKAIVAAAGEVLDEALAADRYDLAVSFTESLLAVARSTGDIALIKDAVARGREIKDLAKQYEPVESALNVLDTNPGDAEANLVVGRYRCIVKNDWEGGMPYLALSNDAELKEVAEQELMQPASAEDQAKLGDAWWDLAERAGEHAKDHFRQRAAHWYRIAVAELAGLTKTKVEQRIADVDLHLEQKIATGKADSRERASKLEVVYLDDIQEVEYKVVPGAQLGKHGVHTWKGKSTPMRFGGRPLTHCLMLPPPHQGKAYVAYDLRGQCVGFAAMVGYADHSEKPSAPSVFRVYGDGKLLWESKPVLQRGIGQECKVPVESVDELRLEVECRDRSVGTHAAWVGAQVTRIAEGSTTMENGGAKRHPVLGYELKPHPNNALKGGKHFYAAFTANGISWPAAQARCKNLGGYLACVESAAEQQFLNSLVRGPRVWIGGRMTAEKWKWINGAAASYSNWMRGQPDNKGGGIPEDCLMMLQDGKWNDAISGRGDVSGFICEWEF